MDCSIEIYDEHCGIDFGRMAHKQKYLIFVKDVTDDTFGKDVHFV